MYLRASLDKRSPIATAPLPQPHPPSLKLDQNSKLNKISRVIANTHLLDKLQVRLDRLPTDPTSLPARVVIVNHLIVAMLWYTLSLWVGIDIDIKRL